MRIILIFIVLSGCAAQGSNSSSDQLMGQTKEAIHNYAMCMDAASAQYISADAAPSEIAEACHSKCAGEFFTYQQSAIAYYTSLVSSSGRTMARERAIAKTEESAYNFKSKVVRQVIEARSQ